MTSSPRKTENAVPKRYDVQITHNGATGRVVVDGKDISSAVVSASWSANAGDVPSLDLELQILDVTQLGSENTEILIPDATAEALIALGWTPPEQEE